MKKQKNNYLNEYFGINISIKKRILFKLGFLGLKQYKEALALNAIKLNKLPRRIPKDIVLKQEEKERFNFWELLGNNSFLRKIKGYPCRGQRTHTNGSTAFKNKLKQLLDD